MKEKTIDYLIKFIDRLHSDDESLVLAKIADIKSLNQIASQLRDEGKLPGIHLASPYLIGPTSSLSMI